MTDLSSMRPRPCPSCCEGRVQVGRLPHQTLECCSRCDGRGFLDPDPNEEIHFTRGEVALIQEAIVIAAKISSDIASIPTTNCHIGGFAKADSPMWEDWKKVWNLLTDQQIQLQRANGDIDMVVREHERK